MEKLDSVAAIPKDIAIEICSRLWRENHTRPLTVGWARCMSCSRHSGGLTKRRWNRQQDHRGCKLVNEAYAQYEAKRRSRTGNQG